MEGGARLKQPTLPAHRRAFRVSAGRLSLYGSTVLLWVLGGNGVPGKHDVELEQYRDNVVFQ